MVPNSIYTVNDNNRNIIVKLSSGSDVSINLTQSSYTFNELGDHLISTLNAHASLSGFIIVKDSNTYKYTISNSTSFRIKWLSSSGSAYIDYLVSLILMIIVMLHLIHQIMLFSKIYIS